MKNNAAENAPVLLIRPPGGSWNPATEDMTEVDLEDGRWAAALLKKAIPAVGRVRGITPKGRFSAPVDLDGQILSPVVEETGETVALYPRLRILGISAYGAQPAVIALHRHLDEQLAEVRRRVDAVFRSAVGLKCPAKRLDGMAEHRCDGGKPTAEAERIALQIAEEIGLDIEWSLEPEPTVAKWFRRIQVELPQTKTLSFNRESRTAQFNLTFSLAVGHHVPSRFHLLNRRCMANKDPQSEFEALFGRIFDILNPAFGVIGDGSQIWLSEGFWKLLREGFTGVVVPKILDEFGYIVTFGDFLRQRSEGEIDALTTLESRQRMMQSFEDAERFYLDTKARERQTLVECDYNEDALAYKRVRAAAIKAEEEKNAAQRALEAGSQGSVTKLAPRPGEFRSVLVSFHSRLGLPEKVLGLLGDEVSGAAKDAGSSLGDGE